MAASGSSTRLRYRVASEPWPAATKTAVPHRQQPHGMRHPRLLDWSELPEWQREDNSYVQSGYRVATPSFWQCLCSWLYLHNESVLLIFCQVNIFSHLISAVIFFVLPVVLYRELSQRYETANTGDVAVFAIYLFGVSVCFTLSVLFHTLMSYSARGFSFGIQLDFIGIILLMWSATAPLVYYTFYDEHLLQRVYWALTSLFAILASIVTFTPAFHNPATKPLRVGVFGALALSTLICPIHGLVKHGWNGQSHRFPLWAIGLTLLFNTVGAMVYVLRFPKKWWPRKFDLFGASHQIMHCAIIFAGLAWVAGMIRAFDCVQLR